MTPETERLPIDAVIVGLADAVDVGGRVIFSSRARLMRFPRSRGGARIPSDPNERIEEVFDELGAGPGARIGISEGREAANPFLNPSPVDAYYNPSPVDAYYACPLDRIDVERPR